MMIIAWIIGLGLLTAMFGVWEGFRQNPNQSPDSQMVNGVREVTLEENRQSHYVATGAINGREVTFLLDTGATDVVVPAGLAQDLGLQPGPTGIAMTANGPVEVAATVIDSLTLGNIHLRDVRASINPGMRGDEVLLGMSALKQVEFSQRRGRLILRQY